MKGIYCTCIGRDTLDEAPFAYRGLDEIKKPRARVKCINRKKQDLYRSRAKDIMRVMD